MDTPLEKGANINAQGGYFGTALQAACYKGNARLVDLLLKKGADINAQGGYYGSALQAACSRGYESSVDMLLAKGGTFMRRMDTMAMHCKQHAVVVTRE